MTKPAFALQGKRKTSSDANSRWVRILNGVFF
jgi:hypothetical protein